MGTLLGRLSTLAPHALLLLLLLCRASALDRFADSLRSPPGQPDPDFAVGDAGRWMRPNGPLDRKRGVAVQGLLKRIQDRFPGSYHWVNEDQTTQKHRGN